MRRLALTAGLGLGILVGPAAVALAVDQNVQATSSAVKSAGGGGDTTPPVVSKLKAKPSPFCNKKSKTCKKPGTRVTFSLSEAASVEADVTDVKKGTSPVIVFHKQGKAGKNSVKFSGKAHGKRLKRGRYSLRLIATDAAGNRSEPVAIRVKIRK